MVGPSINTNRLITIKFLCSYGGKIVLRHPDGKLRYLGGLTRVLSVHRSVTFSELLVKLGEICGISTMSVRSQLPKGDLDALVSITCDEDLANLLEEYDQVASSSSSSSSISSLPDSLKIRAFLSPQKSAKKSLINSPPSSANSSSSSMATILSSTPPRVPTPPEKSCLFRQISPPNIHALDNNGIDLEKSTVSSKVHLPHCDYHHICYGPNSRLLGAPPSKAVRSELFS